MLAMCCVLLEPFHLNLHNRHLISSWDVAWDADLVLGHVHPGGRRGCYSQSAIAIHMDAVGLHPCVWPQCGLAPPVVRVNQ